MRTLYRNGRVYTPIVPGASAFVVDDGLISWIGDEFDAARLVGVRTVDLAGAWVAPAFVDAHVHTTATGLALDELDLAGTATLAEALDVVARAARQARGRPVVGGGWDDTRWPESRPPTASELDRAAAGTLVYLARVDAHSAAVSSALLAAVPGLAGLPGYRPDGLLARAAHDAARTRALAELGAARRAELHRTALRAAAGAGIACVHEMAGPAISGADDLAALLSRPDAAELPEVIGYWGELFGIDTARSLGAVGAAGDLFCDGSLGSHTAALHAPYADEPGTCGVLRFETADLGEHIVRCTRAGLQAGFHAIGDAAVDQVLDACELATARLGGGAGARARHRVEHAEFVRDPGRLAVSGLIASVQPLFDAEWGGADGMYAARLGAERARGLNRFADLAAAGVPLALGSDSPVTRLGPWAAIRAAVHPHDPAAAISAQAAFAGHTRAGWFAAGRDGEGVLRPGAPATFAIWATSDPAPGLPDVADDLPACLATVRRGRTIHTTGLV